MRGKISLESVLGSGTKATFSIPFSKPQFRGSLAPLVNLDRLSDRIPSGLSGQGSGSGRASGTPSVASGMPVVTAAVAHSPAPNTAAQELSEAQRRRTHILIVEDK